MLPSAQQSKKFWEVHGPSTYQGRTSWMRYVPTSSKGIGFLGHTQSTVTYCLVICRGLVLLWRRSRVGSLASAEAERISLSWKTKPLTAGYRSWVAWLPQWAIHCASFSPAPPWAGPLQQWLAVSLSAFGLGIASMITSGIFHKDKLLPIPSAFEIFHHHPRRPAVFCWNQNPTSESHPPLYKKWSSAGCGGSSLKSQHSQGWGRRIA